MVMRSSPIALLSMLRRLRVHGSCRTYCSLALPPIDTLFGRFGTLAEKKTLKEKPFYLTPPHPPHSPGDADDDFQKKEDDRLVQVQSTSNFGLGIHCRDLLRYLTQKDIYMLVGFVCPTVDKKVILPAKHWRGHVCLVEGEVFSACKPGDVCSIPSTVDIHPAETDVVQVLSKYGSDPLLDIMKNKLHKLMTVKASIRNLIGEILVMSVIPLDLDLRKLFAYGRGSNRKKHGRSRGRGCPDVKPGDWRCPVCHFNNFAQNCTCRDCGTSGEWECPKCKFENYKGNRECYKCGCKRTK